MSSQIFCLDCKFGTGPAILSHMAGPFYWGYIFSETKLIRSFYYIKSISCWLLCYL